MEQEKTMIKRTIEEVKQHYEELRMKKKSMLKMN